MVGKRVLALVVATLGRLTPAVAGSPGATPDVATASPAPDAADVEIIVIGTSPDTVRPVVDVFSRRDAHLRLAQVPVFRPADVLERVARRDVCARVWVEVSGTGHARITIADRQAERFLVRELAVPGWPDEMGRETLAQVVESSVTALLENERLGMNRAQAHSVLASAERAIAAPAPESPRLSTSAAISYDVQLFSPQIAFAHGPGASAAVGWDTTVGRMAAWLRAQYVLPQSHVGEAVGVVLQSIALRCGAGLERHAGARFRLAGGLGGGIDVVHVAPRQGTLNVATVRGAHWQAIAVLRAQLTVTLMLGGQVGISMTPSLEIDPAQRHYDVQGSDAKVTVIAPYRVRPGLSLALEWL